MGTSLRQGRESKVVDIIERIADEVHVHIREPRPKDPPRPLRMAHKFPKVLRALESFVIRIPPPNKHGDGKQWVGRLVIKDELIVLKEEILACLRMGRKVERVG